MDDASAAWKAEGHDDGISESLMSKIRSELGLTGKKGTNGKAIGDVASMARKGEAKSSPKGTNGKATLKSGAFPSQTAARDITTGPSKSAFVEEFLDREHGVNLKKVNEAWGAAGYEGTISSSIFFKVKRERGGTGGSPPAAPAKLKSESATRQPEAKPFVHEAEKAGPKPEGTPAASQSGRGLRSGDREKVLDRVEDGIDDLIIELKKLGGMEEALEAMRKVRRVIVRSHQG